jgi:regulator of protease activity HflC (stomatin/prohibitin superfamily)
MGAIVIIAALIGAAALISAVYEVPAGHEAVIFDQRSGTQEQPVREEGWHVKTPFVQDAIVYSVQKQKSTEELESTSDDLQIVDVRVTVGYRLEAGWTPWVYQNIGSPSDVKNIVIEPAIKQSVKATMAQFTAEELIKNRSMLAPTVEDELSPVLNENHIVVTNIDIENLAFSKEFTDSIEQKVVAEQEAQKQKRLEIAAGHEANQTRITAEGEADAIETINQQLAQSQNYLIYKWIEQWNGVTPTTIAGGGNGTAADLLIPVPGTDGSAQTSTAGGGN